MKTHGVWQIFKYCCLLLILLSGVVHAQDNGRISFSVLDDGNIVHVTQIEYRIVGGSLSITSTISVTQRRELRVPEGAAFDRTLVLGNDGQMDQSFKVVLLVDDEQMPFALNDNIQPFHTINLSAGQQERPTITFPGVDEEGLHNFVLVVFYDIEISSNNTVRGIFTPYADSLIVGEGGIPGQSVAHPEGDEFVQGATVPGSMRVPPRGVTISRSAEPTSESDLLESPQRLSAGQSFSYHTHVRNGVPRQGNRDEFVLVSLLEQMQVPVDNRDDDMVAYFNLPINGLATMPAQLSAPDQPGTYNLDLLAIRNPYEFLPRGTSSLEVLHTNVMFQVN